MADQREQDYFCEGMAEEIINALTKIRGLRVTSRTSAFQFKPSSGNIREIGKRLGVKTVLEGSVRKAGDRLRITAQLVNEADDYHISSFILGVVNSGAFQMSRAEAETTVETNP